jgi:hypothetical protein
MIGSPLGLDRERSLDIIHLLESQVQDGDSDLINFLNGVASWRRHR